MNFESERNQGRRTRAKTDATRHPVAIPPPIPTAFKSQQRERSTSIGPTFVSTAVVPAPVPAPDPTEILSSLITSLTVLSDSSRDVTEPSSETETVEPEPSPQEVIPDSFLSSDSENDHHHNRSYLLLDPSDDEVAEAPVIGYARGGPPKPSKKSVRERWAAHRSGKSIAGSNASLRSSNHTLRAPGIPTGIGFPSIERAPSPAAPSISGNSARPSIDQALRTPLKMLFTTRSTDDPTRTYSRASGLSREDDARSTKTMRSMRSAKRFKELNKGSRTPDSQVVPVPDDLPRLQPTVSGSSGNKAYHPLKSTNRSELGDRLIPSRKSSSRHSPVKASSIRDELLSQPELLLAAKAFAIEDENPEDDIPSMRKIKEIQERRTEWNKGLINNREKLSKPTPTPVSISKPDQKASPQDSTRSPVSPGGPSVSATISGPELSLLPVFENGSGSSLPSLSPTSPATPTTNPPRPSTTQNGRVHMAPPSPMKHRRILSGSIRRSGSMRRNVSGDARGVAEEVEAYLSAPRLTQKVRHPRGRTIAFSEVGDPLGFAVFVCPGIGLTRYISTYYDEIAKAQRLRLITPDRPGSGESDPFPDHYNPPLAWADDVAVICQHLKIQKFSLLAHSAGTIFALAIALKMPTYVQGKVHLLAPWITPSQMTGTSDKQLRTANLSTSHKILSKLPTSLFKAANSRLLSNSTPGMDPKSNRKIERSRSIPFDSSMVDTSLDMHSTDFALGRASVMSSYDTPPMPRFASPSPSSGSFSRPSGSSPGFRGRMMSPSPTELLPPEVRQKLYNQKLTERIWHLSTAGADRAKDLLICFERRQPVGFKYRDVTRGVVIRHGRLDRRVSVDNVQWLASVMTQCELQILDKEDHGLMSNASVMSAVLGEVSKEWEEYDAQAKDRERRRQQREEEAQNRLKEERTRFIRTGRY